MVCMEYNLVIDVYLVYNLFVIIVDGDNSP